MLIMENNIKVLSTHEFAEVVLNTETNQHALFATKSFEPNEHMSFFEAGELFTEPNYLTVQIGIHKHLTLVPRFLQYINHGCDPNAFFNTTTMKLVCVKAIKVGDEIRFFYPSSEWKMTQPFVCNCGADNCLKMIKGAAFLDDETIAKYQFTDFIKQQLLARK